VAADAKIRHPRMLDKIEALHRKRARRTPGAQRRGIAHSCPRLEMVRGFQDHLARTIKGADILIIVAASCYTD
jgi:hypothetical protein